MKFQLACFLTFMERKRKIMKNVKNQKSSENGKIEMRPFGTLSEPLGSWKICSEQLRSSSIDR